MSEIIQYPPQAKSRKSIEVGHYYEADIAQGEEHIARSLATYMRLIPVLSEGKTAIVHMVDDYHSRNILSPEETIKTILTAAAINNLTIHYIAREGVFVDYAQGVYDRLRPAITQTSSHPAAPSLMYYDYRREDDKEYEYTYGMEPYKEATRMTQDERNAREIGGWINSDIEIFSILKKKQRGKREDFLVLPDGTRQRVSWSCPWLAATFQAHRLDMLPEITKSGLEPVYMEESDFRERTSWHEYPGVIQVERDAPPYQAEKISSLLDRSYLAVESTVDSLLYALDPEVSEKRELILL